MTEHQHTYRVRFEPRRGAIDWLRALNRHAVPDETWSALAARKYNWTIGARTAHAITLERAGTTSETAHQMLWIAPGIRIALRAGSRLDDRHPYAVEVDFQGALLSTSRHGVEPIDALLPILHRDLYAESYGDLGGTHHWTPGRTDLAADVAVLGPDRDSWVERALFHSGNYSSTAADFAGHSRKQSAHGASASWVNVDDSRGLGSAPGGRTFYLGRDPMLRIYERDKHKGGDWEQLAPTLEAAGFKPREERLVRVEFEIKRKWIMQQTDGKIEGRDLTLADWLASIPSLWAEMFRRTKHTEGSNSRPSDRPASEFWKAAADAIADF